VDSALAEAKGTKAKPRAMTKTKILFILSTSIQFSSYKPIKTYESPEIHKKPKDLYFSINLFIWICYNCRVTYKGKGVIA
ncbi:hypothetical protein ACQKFW_15600, partial [Bacillus subtilis]